MSDRAGSSDKSSDGPESDLLDCFNRNKWLAMNNDNANESAKRQSFAFLLDWVQTEASDIFQGELNDQDVFSFTNMQKLLSQMFEECRANKKRVKQLESRLRDRDGHIEMLEAVVTELQKQFVVQVKTKVKEAEEEEEMARKAAPSDKAAGATETSTAQVNPTVVVPVSDTRRSAKKLEDDDPSIMNMASNDTVSSLSSDDSFDPLVA